LWVKAWYLEEAKGKRSVLITTDLLGMPKALSNNIRAEINKKYGLKIDEVLINISHTHSGPVLEGALVDIYELDEKNKQRVIAYSAQLGKQMLELVGMAMKDIQPVKKLSKNGDTKFQVNWRNNNETNLEQQTSLSGPNDYAFP